MFAQIALPWILGALVGSMLFFAVTVAPTVFQALSAEQGGAFLRRFFPRYYVWGIALGTLSVVAAFLAADAYTTGACVLVTLLFVYARQILMPRINHARDQEIATQIVSFARANLGIKPPDDLEADEQVRFTWQRWPQGDSLIVLDDVTDYDAIKDSLPTAIRISCSLCFGSNRVLWLL